jgi:periplasmic divalent cation tolerance protein
MAELRIVVTTVPPDVADAIVDTLLGERLIACANMHDVRSTYEWKGERCRDTETVLTMETTRDRVALAIARLESLHPYECPKIVVLEPEQVNAAYASWAAAQTRPR